jgi:hypothetical protein
VAGARVCDNNLSGVLIEWLKPTDVAVQKRLVKRPERVGIPKNRLQVCLGFYLRARGAVRALIDNRG